MSERPAPSGPPKKNPRASSRTRRRPFLLEFYGSDVGKKYVMAVTGVMLMGFVLVHMIGNLHVYQGPEFMNDYGEGLRDLGEPLIPRTVLLWVFRLGLITAFVLHIHAAWALARSAHKADRRYQSNRDYIAADWAGRTMRWTGPIVLLFLIWHLADLTWGTVNGYDGGDFVRGDVYHNVVNSLAEPGIAMIYIIANVALGLHLFHGAWSLFQSIGANSPRFNQWRRWFAGGFAAVIVVGNVSFPMLALAGLVDEDNRRHPPQPCIDAVHRAEEAGFEEADTIQEMAAIAQQYASNPIGLDTAPEVIRPCLASLDEFGFVSEEATDE